MLSGALEAGRIEGGWLAPANAPHHSFTCRQHCLSNEEKVCAKATHQHRLTKPCAQPQMLGMHGTVVANYAVDQADLLLAIGVRFDDRVTGKLEAFATRARIVHIDIDPAEISKNKEAHIPVTADSKSALRVRAVGFLDRG